MKKEHVETINLKRIEILLISMVMEWYTHIG